MNNDTALLLMVILAFSLIAIIFTIVYISYYVDCKNVNIISLIISIIFFFCFVLLNCMMTLDYFIETGGVENPSELIIKVFSNYYSYFNRVNSIMTSIIFPFMINCLETGYNSTCYIILESIHRIGHSLWKKLKTSLWKAIILIVIIVAIAVVILYYMFKDKYKLKDPLYYFDYFALALNIYNFIKIYINVGYFMVQLFFESDREGCCKCRICICKCCLGNKIIMKKYYFYSIRLIINKIEKYIKKIQDANKAINDVLKNYNNEINSAFLKFLSEKIKLIKNDLELFKYEGNQNINYNNTPIIYRENNINLNFKTSSERINTSSHNIDKKETNSLKNKNVEEQKPKIEAKDSEKESEKILAQHIRKYKKATRKIKKLNKLIKDITDDFNDEYNYQPTESNDCCKKEVRYRMFQNFKYFVLIAAFVIVILSDILLPIIQYQKSTEISNVTNITDLISDTIIISEDFFTDIVNNTNTTSNDSIGVGGMILSTLIISIIMFCVVVITSSYTIITLFSINRRSYISGDFLSGKKINDSISLMKTIKEICGYAFPLVYCNYYFWKYASKVDFIFYEQIHIPDYELTHGVGLFMFAKLVVISFSIMIFRCCGSCTKFFNNDLDNFNKNINDSNYNAFQDEVDFNYFIQNNKLYHILVN